MKGKGQPKLAIREVVAGVILLLVAGYGFTAYLQDVSHTLYREIDFPNGKFVPLIFIYAVCGLMAYWGVALLRLAWKRSRFRIALLRLAWKRSRLPWRLVAPKRT